MVTPWCASYFSLSPRRIATVSSTDGSPTKTCWNRRSRAGSFSMRSRYSSSVVAPIIRSSPRASIGLSMLPASIAESPPAPAPTTVCSSSMKVMTCPAEALISASTALSRSSNSPRYFAPATIAARSSESTLRPLSESGTSPSTTRWASPSTTAVLPTPGSPISTGLFLVRRESTWITRRISASRPITGSSLPSAAAAVRSTAYFSSAWYVASGSWLVTRDVPRTLVSAPLSVSKVAPAAASTVLAGESTLAAASSRCSVEMKSSLSAAATSPAWSSSAIAAREYDGPPTVEPLAAGSRRELGTDPGLDGRRLRADGLEQRVDDALRLGEQRGEQVHRLDLRVPGRRRRGDGGVDGLLAAGGELRSVHVGLPSCACGPAGGLSPGDRRRIAARGGASAGRGATR